jgi:hypothetical protein
VNCHKLLVALLLALPLCARAECGPLSITPSDILGGASAELPFSRQSGYTAQVYGTYTRANSIPESGIHGAALPGGETLRFGKVADPRNPSLKALSFQLHPDDPVTSKSKRAEISFGRNIEMDKVYWIAFSTFVPHWGSLSSSDSALFGTQVHSGDNSRGLSPSLQLVSHGGQNFEVYAMHSTSTSPSQSNTVAYRSTPQPIPFGRWVDFVFKFRHNTSGSGFLQVWMDGSQIVNYQGNLGYNTPGFRDYAKFGYYNWSTAFNSSRKVLLRSPRVVADPTGDKYNPEQLRAILGC